MGTFPHVEADEKCARAKALTRAWRSTMRPKPTREWVMLELERLQVRVVSGRIGRKEGEDDDDDDEDDDDASDKNNKGKKKDDNTNPDGSNAGGNTASLLSAADMARRGSGENYDDKTGDNKNGSSPEHSPPRNGVPPPHRPLVGGGSAAAYEAARADHYRNIAEQQSATIKNKDGGSKDNSDNNSMGSMSNVKPKTPTGNGGLLAQAPVSMPQLGLTVNPNQHYEMLKLHHMNLLNEIQETTLMMNLYQQQQLQQQQQLSDQQSVSGPSADQQLALQLAQQQQTSSASPFLESLYGMGSNPMNPSQQFPYLNQQAGQFQQPQNQFGLGFGAGGGMGSANNQMHALLRQQQNMLSGGVNGMGMQNPQLKAKLDGEALHEARMEQFKKQERQEHLDKNGGGEKRSFPPQDSFGAKKQKK